jgi:transcriptional regulator with XRE-family HTH domain
MEPMVTNREKELKGFAERLNEAMDDAEYPPKGEGRQVSLAKAMGVSQKGARKWLEGETFPTQDKRIALARLLKVNFEWLSAGTGLKRPEYPKPEHALRIAEVPPATLTEDEQAILRLYRTMGTGGRRTLLEVGSALAAKNHAKEVEGQ